MRIAIVGSGISGLVVGHQLHKSHDITLFEASDHIGGHTHTHQILLDGVNYSLDTGFIVFNRNTYPELNLLLGQLGVASKETQMSFSVKCEQSGLEYNGSTLNTLFAQRRNLLRPSFYGMIRDILRFNSEAKLFLQAGVQSEIGLGAFLSAGGYGPAFIDHYILPMGSAIWSAGRKAMLAFPMHFFASFFENHGMLNIEDRPVWRVIEGGSFKYIEHLVSAWQENIYLKTPVTQIRRVEHGVLVNVAGRRELLFDQVVLAVHANQALAMLADPSTAERTILGPMRYQRNEAILHTDSSVLPKNKRAWAAWNYHVLGKETGKVAVTYNLNMLQGIKAPKTFCVTLNHRDAIDPAKIIKVVAYEHPVFNLETLKSQARFYEISGQRNTHYCGAYWGNGFHEDGVCSGNRVAEMIYGHSISSQWSVKRQGKAS